MHNRPSLEEHATRIEQAIMGLSHEEAQLALIEFLRGKYGTRNRARLNQFAKIFYRVKNVMGSPANNRNVKELNMLEQEERLLTVAEAAKRLGLCIETIRRYIAKGILPAMTLPGGHYRIKQADLLGTYLLNENGGNGHAKE